jgi:hypothetical protein
MVRNQIVNLTFNFFLVHNFKIANEECNFIFDIYTSKPFQCYKENQSQYLFLFAKNIKHCKTPISQMKKSFESVRTRFLIFVEMCLNFKTLF